MSRYPGTQFRVHDNSQATAIVPVVNANVDDTVKYLTSFASVKGPEGITITAGNDFYDKYGTQDNIDFKKYGQPLLQASMDINNGAALIAKRVVLDDASLGNATVAVALTKYRDGKVSTYSRTEVSEGDTKTKEISYPDLIGKIDFTGKEVSKYSLAPVVFSIDNINNYIFANSIVNEYKERYDLYKNYIYDVISNSNTPNSDFLNKLFNKSDIEKVLSGFSQSIYYDAKNNIVDVNTEGRANVRKISSITTGIFNSIQKTYSSSFTVNDITAKSPAANAVSISANDAIEKAELWKAKKDENNDITWEKVKATVDNVTDDTPENGKVTYVDVYEKIKSVTRILPSLPQTQNTEGEITGPTEEDIVKYLKEEISDKHPEWKDIDYNIDNNEYAVIIPDIIISNYTSVPRLLNDIMVKKSGYIEHEYIFPLFTVFDNGRGESIKSIGIEYDAATSVTLKKAVYTLSVYNYSTSKRLEKFSFSLNPYSRNNNTGYSFDIESAVNYHSNQISVKTYYESYDALLDTLKEILQTIDNDIITNNDILFGHTLSGKYPVYNSYYASTILKRNTYVYDYAHLDIFDNDILTVNIICDSDNMTITDDSKVKYYYYNYIRQQKLILERLEKGTNGQYLGRDSSTTNADWYVPFIIIDDSDVSGDDYTSYSMRTIMSLTGLTNGTIVSTSDDTPDISLKPVIPSNFKEVKIKLISATYYEDGEAKQGTCYITYNTNTLARDDVSKNLGIDTNKKPILPSPKFTGYLLNDMTKDSSYDVKTVYVPYATDYLYQEQYRRFFNGDFDRDIFNLDVYFPNAFFDANYSDSVKLAVQRLAAYRGDFMCYMDMGSNKVNSYADCLELIPSMTGGLELTESEDNQYKYIRDMHIAVTCLWYKIRNPYDNKVITVTATYGLSILYINHFKNDVSKVFAGISNNITINNIIEGSVNYIPKIYPTNEMTSLNNIGGVYPSDDETIINEKQLMCDLKVNYGCYYNDRFSIETEYTMNSTESEFSYWNNVALVCIMMQAIRKACPAARYQFITSEDLSVYQIAVETAMKPWKSKFANLKFKYVQDDVAIENKIFYAAIEVVFKPFAQAEIFELTALNYSTLSSNVTAI